MFTITIQFIVVMIVILSTILATADGLTCLTCSQTPIPRECKQAVRCSAGEVCFMEKTVYPDGNAYYNLGCRDKKLCTNTTGQLLPNMGKRNANKTCDNCCDDKNLCNVFGCDSLDYPSKSNRGPICYNCQFMSTDTACNTIETCRKDEYCEVLKTPHPTFDVTYTAKCGSKALCDRLQGPGSIFGKRYEGKRGIEKRSSLCFRCCKGDLCNLGCSNSTVVTTSTSTSTMN